MSKLERFFIGVLGVLAVLAVSLVFLAPRLVPSEPEPVEPLEPGETETMPARVVEILEEGTVEVGGQPQPYQRLRVHVEAGSLEGQDVAVEEGTTNVVSQETLFRVGDRVYLERVVGPHGDRFYISDFVRTEPLLVVVALFFALVILVGRMRGARSLLGTLFSLGVVFFFILPMIKAGHDPVWISVLGSVALLGFSTYAVYGLNYKATAAVAGMMASLLLTALLAAVFAAWTHLTGVMGDPEQASYLITELGGGIDFRGLVLAGIIIGSLGVLDDICVGQAAAVFELANVNRGLSWQQLFRSSLNIGRDHIAAMVNTLFLAYAGASLPLLLVFTIYTEPILRRINREPLSEEIVRTVVGSIGLVLAVPITGLIASLLARFAVEREQAWEAE